jgi:hypothetical protein
VVQTSLSAHIDARIDAIQLLSMVDWLEIFVEVAYCRSLTAGRASRVLGQSRTVSCMESYE